MLDFHYIISRVIMKKIIFIFVAIMCHVNIICSDQYSEHVIRTMADNLGFLIAEASHSGMSQSKINSGFEPIKDSITQELSENQFNIFKQHLNEYIQGKRPSKQTISQLALQDVHNIKNSIENNSLQETDKYIDIIQRTRKNMFARREIDVYSFVFNNAFNANE